MLRIDCAIHLLIHLEELMDGVARIGVIGHGRTRHLERSRRQGVDIGDAGIRTFVVRQACAAGSEQVLIRSRQSRIATGQA